MDYEDPSTMRRLGRLAARIRAGFFEGLRGPQPTRIGPVPGDRTDPEAPARRVVVRRTTVEELEITEPERR